jgi:hypothetical protein
MSTVAADFINNASGNVLYVNGYPQQPGRVIEYLANSCDGSSVTVGSGTYTFENVTGVSVGSVTYIPLTGSFISYCPPPGTRTVIYRFNFSAYWQDAHAIAHFKFYIDGYEVVYARHNRSGFYFEDRNTFEWPIVCNADATNYNYGRLNSWTTPKDLYMYWRDYGTSDDMNLHGTYYWDGTSSTQFSQPQLSIIALA